MGHVAFVTCSAHAGLTNDDGLAANACEARGIRVSPAVWDDPAVVWSAYDAVIMRSTWDYHRRAVEFDAWLTRLEGAGARVWNPVPLLRWNANKRYLGGLAERGVPTVPTASLGSAGGSSLGEIMDTHGWEDAVVKPVISATAYGTHRLRRADADAFDVARPASSGDELLVQPFVAEIESVGEWSLVFLGGHFSHSIRKRPARGDFRVQTEFGGSSAAEAASGSVVEAAAAVLRAVEGPWLYARVDGVETDAGFLLMELEMLEPMLFFGWNSDAPARFADAILKSIR